MKAPEAVEKLVEKIRQTAGLNYLPISEVTFGISTRVEISEEQFKGLIDALKSEGFKFYSKSGDGLEIYRNEGTHEDIGIQCIEDEKYFIGNIIYHWKEG